MPLRIPGSGVLGPRPSTAPQQAYFAGHPLPTPPPAPSATGPVLDVWNHQAMLAALANSGVPPGGPQATEWFFDTGASSHMASTSGNLATATPTPHSPPIIVGNGASLPASHHGESSIATARAPLRLHNVLVSPSLVKNLISVRSLTRDNNVSIEFDPFGFSVKDLPTATVIL